MPVFNVHVARGQYSSDQRRKIADALSQSLVEGFGLPFEDQFVAFSQHDEGKLFMHPTYMDVERSPAAMMISVQINAQRPKEDKRRLLKSVVGLLELNVGIRPDDVFISLIAIPAENFSFGRGFSPFDTGD